MSRGKTHEEYLAELTEANPLFASGAFTLETEYRRATDKIRCRCARCGETFERRPDHLKAMGCPECDSTGKGPISLSHDKFLKRLLEKNGKFAEGKFEVIGEYAGSSERIACRCPEHGEWETTPTSLLKGAGCPKCANRMTYSDFLERLANRNGQYARGDIEVLGGFSGSKVPIKMRCLVCGHEWEQSPNALLNNRGCPNYRRHPGWVSPKAVSKGEFLERLSKAQPDVELLDEFDDMTKPLRCRCRVCGREWITNATKLTTVGNGCPDWRKHPGYKSPKMKSHADFIEELRAGNAHYANGNFEVVGEYEGIDSPVGCRCLACGREWSRAPYDLIHKGSGCPECSARRRGIASRKTHEEFLEELGKSNEFYATGKIEVVGQYSSSKEPIACHCNACGNDWDASPQNLLLNGAGCPRCSRSGTSRVEQLLAVALERELGEDAVLSRDKTAIGSELDIYVPSQALAIEYGSWFWHEGRLGSDMKKIEKCRELGIDLITIYDQCETSPCPEDEWVRTYSFDLWAEKGQLALKHLVDEILSRTGSTRSFTAKEWKRLRAEAASRATLRSTDELIAQLCEANAAYADGKFKVIGEYTGAHNRIECVCEVCGHTWSPSPSALLSGSGCPSCAGMLKKTQEGVIAEAAKHNPDIEIIGKYQGASIPFAVRCRICGHEWKTTTGQIRRGAGCPKFRGHPDWNDPTARTQEQFLREVESANPNVEPLGLYKNANTKVRFRCKDCGYEWSTKPAVIINLGGGCPKCAGTKRMTHDEFIAKLAERNGHYAAGEFEIIGTYVNSKTKVKCRCHKHGDWEAIPNTLLGGSGCPECGGSKRMTKEVFLSKLKEKNAQYARGEFDVVGEYINSKTPIECRCHEHGSWFPIPNALLRGTGCPNRMGHRRPLPDSAP